MRLLEYMSELEASQASQSAHRAIVRKRGGKWVEGMGEPPGERVGPGPRNLPHQGYATHAVPVLAGRSTGQAYLQITDEMAALPESTERVDGRDVDVPRTGRELDPDTVLKRPPDFVVGNGPNIPEVTR